MKHYYDPGVDDCPIHEDSDVEHMYELHIKFPIGYSFDFPSWKAADKACFNLIRLFESFISFNLFSYSGSSFNSVRSRKVLMPASTIALILFQKYQIFYLTF